MKRKKLSKRVSRKRFAKHSRPRSKNLRASPMRGGYRI